MDIARELEKKRHEITFSANTIKIIAMMSMLIDHIAVMLIYNGKLYGYDRTLYENAIKLPEATSWFWLYHIFRCVGRLAFPLFAFLIVEGFRKTSNLFKYILRILILALVSEIPFNLLIANKFFYFDVQNVVFTYFFGLLMLLAIKCANKFPTFLSLIFAVIAGVICYFLKTDYWLEGILLIYIFYMTRNDLNVKCILAAIVTFLLSFQKYHGLAILSIFFIYFYDGQKGYFDLKRLSYIFYPAHMIILYAIVYFSYIIK